MSSKNQPKNTHCSGSKTRQLIAGEYNWSIQTLKRRLKKLQIDLPPGLVAPKWQKQIYEELGYPPSVSKKDYDDI